MLIYELREIGNKLLAVRKKAGLTQSEVAEIAELSDRTYADIERGTVNMRVSTLLKICDALKITPDIVLTENAPDISTQKKELIEHLDKCTPQEQKTALELLTIYLESTK